MNLFLIQMGFDLNIEYPILCLFTKVFFCKNKID